MLYTPATKKAMKLCFEAHKDQVDKNGVPYVFHPFHLAEQMQDEQTTVAALLHDVAEDSGYTLEDLAAMGFDEAVINALRLLTHDKRVPYLEYVARKGREARGPAAQQRPVKAGRCGRKSSVAGRKICRGDPAADRGMTIAARPLYFLI